MSTDGDSSPAVVDAEVDSVSSDSATVTRTATLAEVVSEPREVLHESTFDSVFELYDRLLSIDAETAGAVRSQAQMASGFRVIHPAMEGDQEQPTEQDEVALDECRQLVRDLQLELAQPSIFKNMVAMGNDINKMIFETGEGVTGLQSLPLSQVTIIDDDTAPPTHWEFPAAQESSSAYEAARRYAKSDGRIDLDTYTDKIVDLSIQSGDKYVLNEGTPQEKEIEPWKILHFAIEKRSNHFEDRFGRDTYGVWGAPRLEPTKFPLQAKHNTLTNKVAMDDSLIAREIYKIDVEALFGHIKNDEERTNKAEDYADELRRKLESMDPDDKPILPKEVSMEVRGPEGKAREHGEFLTLMNDSIMHALTFHVGGVGRDAGGPMIGNRPAKDQSLQNVMHLRKAMSHKLRELFRTHLMLRHEEWRIIDEENPSDISSWSLDPDITVPRIEWDPLEMGDRERMANVAAKLFKNKVITRNEARELMGFDPMADDDTDKLFQDRREENNPPKNDSEEDDSEEDDTESDDEPPVERAEIEHNLDTESTDSDVFTLHLLKSMRTARHKIENLPPEVDT